MSTNQQLQKVTPSRIRRIRHRRRLIAGSLNARIVGRQPGLHNFLVRESTRANAIGGISGVTDVEILAAVEGIGTGVLNRNIIDTFDIAVTAQNVNASRVILDYTNKGIPII